MNSKVLLVFPLFSLLINSCTVNRRINFIVPGEFSGTNEYDETETYYYLSLVQIDETEYNEANGINVIEDLVKKNYYQIEFYWFEENNQYVRYDFVNLHDAYNGATGTYIAYKDDNGSWFEPYTTSNNDELPYEECSYTVHIVALNIYTNLFFREE